MDGQQHSKLLLVIILASAVIGGSIALWESANADGFKCPKSIDGMSTGCEWLNHDITNHHFKLPLPPNIYQNCTDWRNLDKWPCCESLDGAPSLCEPDTDS